MRIVEYAVLVSKSRLSTALSATHAMTALSRINTYATLIQSAQCAKEILSKRFSLT